MKAEPVRKNIEWFKRARWGVFMHFLGSPSDSAGDWNERVDAFDVRGLGEQLERINAGYFCITVGQGSGHYCAPNSTYDRIAGVYPGKCSRRDLVSDLYDVLHPLGIALMVYVPSEGSWADFEARKGLGMHKHWNDRRFMNLPADEIVKKNSPETRWVEFMLNWEKVVRDWSLRWGKRVRGWWVDGCYHPEIRYPENREPNLKTLSDALKSGNPDSIVAFNTGAHVPVSQSGRYDDYTAGELKDALWTGRPVLVEEESFRDLFPGRINTRVSGIVRNAQYHVLTCLGEDWGKGAPRFSPELVSGYTKLINSLGGVISWDAPHDGNGLLPLSFEERLAELF